MDNFGASDCWTAQFFGLFPNAKREQMADWLFSLETATNGQHRGIGLSLWRFNIGTGSAAQGDVNDPEGLMVSAYVNAQERTLTCVAINYSERVRPVCLAVSGLSVRAFVPYLTADTHADNLKPQSAIAPLTPYNIPSRAVVPFVGRF